MQPHRPLPEAPGARAARICGILAIVLAVTCIGIPVAFILAIVALVKHSQAKNAAAQVPGAYLPVPATGLVTGIVGLVMPLLMLPFIGIVSAIAVPAMLGHRSQARTLLAKRILQEVRADLTLAHAEASTRNHRGEDLRQALTLKLLARTERNPWDPALPAVTVPVHGFAAASPEALEAWAGRRVPPNGQITFTLSEARPDGRPLLAGAFCPPTPGSKPVVVVTPLD